MSVESEDLEVNHTVKNIVREIEREFVKVNLLHVDRSLITLYVKLLLHDPNWQIDGQVLFSREKIQKLINRVVDDFHRKNEPDMITINIQNYLLNTFKRRYEILEKRRKSAAHRTHPLRVAILEQNTTKTEDLTNIFHKILVYFILLSGMGNPLKPGVYKQSRSVLRSILTIDELRTFLDSPYVIRVEELDKMLKVFSGIRIYNNYCGRGGEGLPDLLGLLFSAVEGLNDFLIYLFYEADEKIEILSSAIASCYVPQVLKQKFFLKLNLPEDECVFEEDLEYSKRLILVYKQFQEAIQFLLDEVAAVEQASKQDEGHFQEILEYLYDNVVPNFHIHVNLVFPSFTKLSNIWGNFQDTIIILNVIREVAQNIEEMVKLLKYDNNLVKYYVTKFPPKKMYRNAHVCEQAQSECEILRAEDLATVTKVEGQNISLEYEGHCCWALVLANGFLIKGDAHYGIVRFNGRFYVFSSPLALQCFVTNPTYYINHVLQLARNRCAFINFLKLSADLDRVKDDKDLIQSSAGDSQVAHTEMASQFVSEWKSWIDPTYHFSLWKYKADALNMATVKRCKTVGTMTDKTFCKNSMRTETYSLRDKGNMTKTDGYTNTPTPLVFLHGLRGDRRGNKQSQLNLTYWDFKPSYFTKNQ